jgi:anti-anti-sigma factor
MMRAAGEIDIATAPTLRAQLAAARAARLTTLLDLSAVSFIDSSGLHVLMDGARWSMPTSGRSSSSGRQRRSCGCSR